MASVLKVDTIKSLAGNEAITISESGVPHLNIPLFKAFLNATQTGVATGALTKVNVNEVVFDTNWDGTNNSSVGFNETNYRYIAPVNGYYQFDGVIRCSGTSLTVAAAYIYVDGVIAHTGNVIRGSGVMHPVVSTITYLTAGQYAELYGYVEVASGGSFAYASDVATSIFSGFLVRGA